MRILDLQRRLREVGRIRIGEQVATSNGKSRPSKLTVFRLTSRDETVIRAAAERFGGNVEPWDAPDGPQWQVKTTATEMPAVVPPGDMAFSQAYEQWTAGGCRVRCDGHWDHQGDKACHCNPEARDCAIHTRLSVMLPDLPGLGVWRLDTSGYYAAVELGGVVDLAAGYAERGQMLPARLRLEQRSVKRIKPDGKTETRKFVVPVLDLDVHPMTLAGGTPAGELGTGTPAPGGAPSFAPVPATLATPPVATVADQVKGLTEGEPAPRRRNAAAPIPSTGTKPRTAAEAAGQQVTPPVIPPRQGAPSPAAPAPKADPSTETAGTLTEALAAAGITPAKALRRARELAGDHGHPLPMAIDEVTGDVLDLLVDDLGITAPSEPGEKSTADKRRGKMHARCAEVWPGDKTTTEKNRKALIGVVTGGRSDSSNELEPAEWDDLFVALDDIEAGTMELFRRSNGDYELRLIPQGVS